MNIEKLKSYLSQHPIVEDVDQLSLGFIDFKKSDYKLLCLSSNGSEFTENKQKIFFDLASLTKPLTIGLIQFLRPQFLKTKSNQLLLNHRSGLPTWGLLSKHNWRQQITSYKISESDVAYSDFGAIRAQIEFETQFDSDLYEETSPFWAEDVLHWREVEKAKCLVTGERAFKKIKGDVHDPNAWVIQEKVSHAGIFATIEGLIKTLLLLEAKYYITSYFFEKIEKIDSEDRFVYGWDRVMDNEDTLAGGSCSKHTIGHLGFTGTSFWIDCEKKRGVVILSNITKKGWYQKHNLNEIRRQVGNYFWEYE